MVEKDSTQNEYNSNIRPLLLTITALLLMGLYILLKKQEKRVLVYATLGGNISSVNALILYVWC